MIFLIVTTILLMMFTTIHYNYILQMTVLVETLFDTIEYFIDGPYTFTVTESVANSVMDNTSRLVNHLLIAKVIGYRVT